MSSVKMYQCHHSSTRGSVCHQVKGQNICLFIAPEIGLSFLLTYVMNTWRREPVLWRLHHIIAFRSQLLRWKRGFQLYCFLKRHNQKRSSGGAVTLRWLCAHSGNSLWALRSSVDTWVAFYLESVLSWQRWQSAGARLENSGMTTVTLHEFKPDLLLLQNPQMSCIFVLRPSNQ